MSVRSATRRSHALTTSLSKLDVSRSKEQSQKANTTVRHRRTHEQQADGEVLNFTEEDLDNEDEQLGLDGESPEPEQGYMPSTLSLSTPLTDMPASLGGLGGVHMGPPPQLISAHNY